MAERRDPYYTDWGEVPRFFERPSEYGEWPPLTAEEMRGIAEYLESMKNPHNYERIEDAQLYWIDKACEADRQSLEETYNTIVEETRAVMGEEYYEDFNPNADGI